MFRSPTALPAALLLTLALAACGQAPSATATGGDAVLGAPPAAREAISAKVGLAGMAPRAQEMSLAHMPVPMPPQTGDRFSENHPNKYQIAAEQPVSTFSADVDTASYAYVRRALREGARPPQDAVRVEEMVNYFPYSYPGPDQARQPFKATATVLPSPWSKDSRLLHIGLKGYDRARAERPRLNLVFLIDVSGSMMPRDRLPLVVQSLSMLTGKLQDDDTVGIVTYAGQAGIRLEPTKGSDKAKILAALNGLASGGSTAGHAGIQQAYELAQRNFDPKAVNRVILATDGDFNVGVSDVRRLEQMIAEKRKSGIYLTLIGVGTGNLNDRLMQHLAQAGNGTAYYLDSTLEANKILSGDLGSTLFPIADDVKFQVEFNPDRVAEYRLIGYETRMLSRTDFNDDLTDAGEIGSGHAVTAIYEIVPKGSKGALADPLRYARKEDKAGSASPHGDEIAFLRMRYKLPGESESRLAEQPVLAADALSSFERAPEDVRFAAAVAAFAQKLRGEPAVGGLSYAKIAELARAARGLDKEGWRAEFVQLVETAESLK